LKDMNGQTPLSQAVEGESIAVVRLLLAQGVKIDYSYTIVSESIYIWMGLYKIDSNTVTLDYCSM
jgi:ankyrin repeat protein